MTQGIVFLEIKQDWEKEYIVKNLRPGLSPVFFAGSAQDHWADLKEATILSTFINSRITGSDFNRMPKLGFIATRSTGFDHIDIKSAASRGIPVANVPVYGENTVAEHTFALILSLARNLRKSHFRVKDGNFSSEGLMGFDLKGKTLGVVGTGHIGLHVIHMARGFGLKVLASDIKQNQFIADVLGFDYVSLDELWARSDIISLHVPYMPSTHHLVNAETIRKIKKGAILINTSRGGLVETAALVKALDEGILVGAGLDVLEGEELILEERRLLETAENKESWEKLQLALKNHILLNRDNVIYTPHIAFYSREAVLRILETTVRNIHGFIDGTTENIINSTLLKTKNGAVHG